MDVLPQGAAPPDSYAFSGSSEQPHPRSAATVLDRPRRRTIPPVSAGQPAHTGPADRAPGLDLPASLGVQLAGEGDKGAIICCGMRLLDLELVPSFLPKAPTDRRLAVVPNFIGSMVPPVCAITFPGRSYSPSMMPPAGGARRQQPTCGSTSISGRCGKRPAHAPRPLRLPLSTCHRCDLWNKQINGGDPEGRADLRRYGSDLRSGGSAGSPALGTREARGAAAKTSHCVPRGPNGSHRGQCPPGSV
jgi:hypothetical protein